MTCGTATQRSAAINESNVTSPKPRERPSGVRIATQSNTWQYSEKCSLKTFVVVLEEMPPTKSFVGRRFDGLELFMAERTLSYPFSADPRGSANSSGCATTAVIADWSDLWRSALERF
jgi:hypothetical protein